jgi:hypothetical protein
VCGQGHLPDRLVATCAGVLTGKHRPGQQPPPDSRAANSDMNVAMDRLLDDVKASGIELTPGTLAAIEQALGDTPVEEPTLAPLARPGVFHRAAGRP